MTTGELLSYHSSVSDVSALTHLRHIIVNDQYVKYEVGELQEEILQAEIVDTMMCSEVVEVLEVALVDERMVATIVEEINEGTLQC